MTTSPSFALIGAQLGLGAQDHRTAGGPAAIRDAGVERTLTGGGVDARWWKSLVPMLHDAHTHSTDVIAEFCGRLSNAAQAAKLAGHVPLVLGGDHSIAIGTWSGIHNGRTAPMGMIWIDAHMDAHTPETSESGAVHGMPLAVLMGYGDPRLTGIAQHQPVLDPKHVCLIGVRSYEHGEAALLKRLGVRVITPHEVHVRGVDAIAAEALAIAAGAPGGYGVSLDLDAIDPTYAPGTGTREAGGLTAGEARKLTAQVVTAQGLAGFEMVELNAVIDERNKTVNLAIDILRDVCGAITGAQANARLLGECA